MLHFWFIVSLVLTITFTAYFAAFPYAIKRLIKKEIAIVPDPPSGPLVPGTEQTKNWITPPFPLYAKFSFFNVTNKDEVTKKGKKPNLTEIGPFYYRYYHNKFNVTWDGDESHVSYHLDTYYVYDKNLSIGDPKNYNITTLNVPLLGLLLKLEAYKKKLLERELEEVIEVILQFVGDHDLFYEKTAHELLWGYDDTVLELLKEFKLTDYTVFALETNHSTNDSLGFSTVRTGKYDPKLVGEFTQWNNLREIALWNSSEARKLDGTGGYVFHPNVQRHDVLRAFVAELYRSGDFVYSYDTKVHDINLYHYVVAPYELENASTYSRNYGYSAFGKPGVLNLTAVFPENLPIFVSKPHFLDADQSYLQGVNGLHPIRSIHDSFFEVEPLTGVVLHAAKRLQFNVLLKRDQRFEQLKEIPESTMFPWFIATEESVITKLKADEFKAELLTPIRGTSNCCYDSFWS